MADTQIDIEKIDWQWIRHFITGIEKQVLKDMGVSSVSCLMPWWMLNEIDFGGANDKHNASAPETQDA